MVDEIKTPLTTEQIIALVQDGRLESATFRHDEPLGMKVEIEFQKQLDAWPINAPACEFSPLLAASKALVSAWDNGEEERSLEAYIGALRRALDALSVKPSMPGEAGGGEGG